MRLLHLAVSFVAQAKAVVTIHSWRRNGPLEVATKWAMKSLGARVICVSAQVADALDMPCDVLPAYLPADLDREEPLPADLTAWLKDQKSQGRRIVVSNAFRLDFFRGDDLYGLDLIIDAAAQLKDGHEMAFVFVVANPCSSGDYICQQRRRAAALGVDRLLIYEGALSYTLLLAQADASIRATCTDGDAISVRESLQLGCSVVASDAVQRPAGTILFANRNADSLAAQLAVALSGTAANIHAQTNNFTPLFDIYRELS